MSKFELPPGRYVRTYVHRDTSKPFYSDQESFVRNTLLAQAFEVCEKEDADIYEFCLDIFMRDFYKLYPPEL